MTSFTSLRRRLAGLVLLAGLGVLQAGCSQEFVSIDDQYQPTMPEQRFPITVAERPVKLMLDAGSGRIDAEQAQAVERFAYAAAGARSSPVRVAYPTGSRTARLAANEAAHILVRHGVARERVRVEGYEGRSNVVAMSFTSRYAATKPCGDFSENLRNDQFNNLPPDFGCSFQHNMAAMVTNPEDFVHPRKMTPQSSNAQNSSLENYYKGGWTASSGGSDN